MVPVLSSCDQITGMRIGVNYTAKMLCSCVFVQNRDEASCYGDMMDNVQSIPVEIDREKKHVRASIAGVFVGEASHREGRGCQLQ
jgi:hypothetical protein